MARITLEEIAQELAEENWKVLSTEYKNLSTEMCFECNEGHKVFTSWDKLRKKRECPVCKQNGLKENRPILIEKKKNTSRVFALDQATHKTGWAVFDNGTLVRYGVMEASGEEVERFHKVKEWLISMIAAWKPDLVAIEGIQYQTNVSMGVTTFQTLARLQGVLLDTCYEQLVPFVVCPTNTWRAYCGVKGRARTDKKKSMQLLVKEWFDISVTDDESDAIGIGKFASDIYKKQTEIINWE